MAGLACCTSLVVRSARTPLSNFVLDGALVAVVALSWWRNWIPSLDPSVRSSPESYCGLLSQQHVVFCAVLPPGLAITLAHPRKTASMCLRTFIKVKSQAVPTAACFDF